MVRVGDNWKCPYCGHAQVIAGERFREGDEEFNLQGWKHGQPVLVYTLVVCANNACRELSLDVALGTFTKTASGTEYGGPGKSWTLLPPSSAKPQPNCIPEPICNDYYEACAIRDLSPKASATLTRRCLQGMIRDFCGISKGRLIDEIDELRKRVDAGQAPLGVQLDTVNAIDDVRHVGNIGAHMKADINVIVDVDPNEAQVLIELVELLFLEWYVARAARADRLANLKSIAEGKKSQQQVRSKTTKEPSTK
jgi:uncharacterized protein DUF4145